MSRLSCAATPAKAESPETSGREKRVAEGFVSLLMRGCTQANLLFERFFAIYSSGVQRYIVKLCSRLDDRFAMTFVLDIRIKNTCMISYAIKRSAMETQIY